MIQRLQTVYLAIAAIALTVAFFFPLITFINEGQIWFNVFLKGYQDYSAPKLEISSLTLLPLQIINALSIILAVSTIFLYKNRKLQMKLARLGIVLTLVLIALIFFYFANMLAKITSTAPDFNQVGIYLLLIGLIMFVLANRGIMKDEKLVRAADRLR